MENIVLIGFMGSGKTTVGRKLAQRLGMNFVDTDDVIEERQGKSIKEIFTEQGEDYFRILEKKVVSDVGSGDNLVIACGGGVVLDPSNVAILKENGILIYLKASRDAVCRRVESSTDRPLLDVSDQRTKVRDLLCMREKIYEQVADVTVDTSSLSVDQVIENIEKKVEGLGGER